MEKPTNAEGNQQQVVAAQAPPEARASWFENACNGIERGLNRAGDQLGRGMAAAGIDQAASEIGRSLGHSVDHVANTADSINKGLSTERRPTWNNRFYLLMVDVRTLANSLPEDIVVLRSLSDAAGIPAGLIPTAGVTTSEVTANGVRCIWCWPSEYKTPAEVPAKMLYVHGGAFCLGSPETHKQLTMQLALRAKTAVLVPDYRRCPESPMSDAHADVIAAYTWLVSDPGAASGVETPASNKPINIVLAGESAGANIALVIALKIRRGEVKLPQASGLILMSPFADLVDAVEQRSASWAENESNDFVLSHLAMLFSSWVLGAQKFGGIANAGSPEGKAQLASLDQATMVQLASLPEVSPALSTDFSGLPPTLVTTGACETLRDSQLALVEKLRAAKVKVESEVYADMPHAFGLVNFAATSDCPAPSDVLDRAAVFAKSCQAS